MTNVLSRLSLILLLVTCSHQDAFDNEIEIESDGETSFADVLTNSLSGGVDAGGDEAPDLGGMLSSFMSSEGGKQIGDMLMGGMAGAMGGGGGGQHNNNVVAAQIIQGIGSLLTQSGDTMGAVEGNGGGAGGFDPSMIGTVISMLGASASGDQHQVKGREQQDNGGFDMGSLLSMAGTLFSNQNQQGRGGGGPDLMSLLPMLLNTVQSFVGPEADERVHSHADHANLLPPIIERIHVLFDHFVNSDLGQTVLNFLGAEKFMRQFADDKTGQFSYGKFVELLENRSFRRHWIRVVTLRVAEMVSYLADPYTQRSWLTTGQFLANNFLKGQGIPKSALLDNTHPTESITNLINHLSVKYFDYKFDSRQYVKPAVTYVQDLFKIAEKKGYLGRKFDSSEISHKLTDTINLEIIEPVARVNRAFRFAKKVPQCDQYVICLVNHQHDHDGGRLPALKGALSKGSSLLASWFLSAHTGTPFWTLYNVVTAEGSNCKSKYNDACNDFHVEEIKVTTEYVHNEL